MCVRPQAINYYSCKMELIQPLSFHIQHLMLIDVIMVQLEGNFIHARGCISRIAQVAIRAS